MFRTAATCALRLPPAVPALACSFEKVSIGAAGLVMFTGFLFHLRGHGLKVSPTEWLALMEALVKGHGRSNLKVFYALARALLIKKESHYDAYDRAFASYFEGVEDHFEIDEELWQYFDEAVSGA